jgi:transglutaminase-like putative cysteine protease
MRSQGKYRHTPFFHSGRKTDGIWSTHAWAQIYLPGTGWTDFDPTSGSVGKIGLVTVAVVRDPHHAIPLHGTFIGFPSDHLGMEVQVSVTSGTPEAIWATPHRSAWPQFHQSV